MTRVEEHLFGQLTSNDQIRWLLLNGHTLFCSFSYFKSKGISKELALAIAPRVCARIADWVTFAHNEEGITLKIRKVDTYA